MEAHGDHRELNQQFRVKPLLGYIHQGPSSCCLGHPLNDAERFVGCFVVLEGALSLHISASLTHTLRREVRPAGGGAHSIAA